MLEFMQGFKNLRKSKKVMQGLQQPIQASVAQKRQRLEQDTDTLSASSSESDSNIYENELFAQNKVKTASKMQLPRNTIILP